MIIPYFLKRAVEVIEHDHELRGLRFYILLIIGLALVQGVARTFSRFTIFNIGRDIEYDLRNDLFAHLETLPQSYYQKSQTGDLMSRLVNDIGAVRMMIGRGSELSYARLPLRIDHGDDQRAAHHVSRRPISRALDREATVAAAHGADRQSPGRARHALFASSGESFGYDGRRACARDSRSPVREVGRSFGRVSRSRGSSSSPGMKLVSAQASWSFCGSAAGW
jgi:ABC-type multidrug transport system fused ATPase/permease subunit